MMASTTAPIGPFRALAGGARPPLRQLWQVPTFALGLIAFAAVCAIHPPWHPSVPPEDSSLAELRELLKQKEIDRDHALVLGARAVQGASTAQSAGEAHLLLGTAYLILAERAGPGKGKDEWREARGQLEQARALGVADEDRAYLDYRLAKAWAHTGEPPLKVIAALAQSIEGGADDDVDALGGYGLLAEEYLKLPKPDLEGALAATDKQIGRPIVAAELLAPARLRRGELLLRLGRAEDGRDVLKNIGAKAPPPLLAKARRLRVGSLEADGLWAEAVPVWREIKEESPSADRDAVLYHLGLCLRNSGEQTSDEVLRVWDECLARNGTGEEGPAAALAVGDLRLRLGQVEPALAAFERAVHDVKEAGDWHNTLVPLPRAREVFEAGCKTARVARAFEASMRLARLYERLAPPGRAPELLAEAAEAGARAALEDARHAAGDEARNLLGNAEALLRQAGAAYDQAADAQNEPDDKAERLWRAGNNYLDGRDASRAADAFVRFLKIAQPESLPPVKRFGPRLNEAWYKMALARRDGNLPGVQDAFEKANTRLEWPSRYLYRARYELAMVGHVYDPKTGTYTWTDKAKDQLEDNLHLLRQATTDRDDEAREKTLYALAFLYYDRREQRGVISRTINTLEEALHEFPNHPDAIEARYKLAVSYRERADQRNASLLEERPTRDALIENQQKVMQDHEKAFANYVEVSRALEALPTRDQYEEGLLFCALRMAADVRYWAGDYEKSGEMFAAVAERWRDRRGFETGRASALAGAARAYTVLSISYPNTDSDREARAQLARRKAQQALAEIRAELPRLEPKVRKEFEDYIKTFEQPMR